MAIQDDPTEVQPIVFYDGECGLCNRFVQFMLRHDPDGVVKFSALQGKTYEHTVFPQLGAPDMTTVILWEGEAAYTHSDAVLRATARLGGWVGVLARIAIWVPGPVRNLAYRFISRNRYRWFGRADSCRVPQGSERTRFLP